MIALSADLDIRRQLVSEEWEAAVSAASLSVEKVAYWTSVKTPEKIRDRAAMYFLPGPPPSPPFAFTGEQLREATTAEMARKHRIMVHLDYELPDGLDESATRAYFAAVLRHELEHARQADARGGRVALEIDQGIVDPVLFKKAGRIKGGVGYYNMKPSEMDANAAASVYLRERFPEAVAALLESDIGAMVRSNTGPEDPSTLLRRTVCFLVQLKGVAEAWADPHPISALLATFGGAEVEEIWAQVAGVEMRSRA